MFYGIMLFEYRSFVCNNLFGVFLLFSHEILSANFVRMYISLKEFPSFSITIAYASYTRFTYTLLNSQPKIENSQLSTVIPCKFIQNLDKCNAFYLLQLFIGIPMPTLE